MKKLKLQAFTLVELIVVITILAILGTIGFLSIMGYQKGARDATRLSDITSISKVVELAELQNGSYPLVTNPVNISFSGSTIWKQGSFGIDSFQESQRISEIPVDPLTGNQYVYSTTLGTREYQVGSILENGGLVQNSFVTQLNAATNLVSFSSVKIRGNYNGKFLAYTETIDANNKNIYILGVPSILSSEISNVSLETIINNKSFLHDGKKSIPSTYSGSLNGVGIWDFTPGTSGAVVYSGSTSTLSSQAGKIDMLTKLRAYYKNTTLANVNQIKDIVAIDPVANPVSAVETINTFIQTQVSGLSDTNITPTPLGSVHYGNSPSSFVTTWSSSYGDSAFATLGGTTLRLPLQPGTYNFTVDWGDGTIDTITSYNQAEATHTYGTLGEFTIIIDGTLSGWSHAGIPYGMSLTNIRQWGNMGLDNGGSQFAGNAGGFIDFMGGLLNISAKDSPNLSNITNLSNMFRDRMVNGDISGWDVSNVTNMNSMFYSAVGFDQDISGWNVANVISHVGFDFSTNASWTAAEKPWPGTTQNLQNAGGGIPFG